MNFCQAECLPFTCIVSLDTDEGTDIRRHRASLCIVSITISICEVMLALTVEGFTQPAAEASVHGLAWAVSNQLVLASNTRPAMATSIHLDVCPVIHAIQL